MSSPRHRDGSNRSRHARTTTFKDDEPTKGVRHTSPPRAALPSTPQLIVGSVHYSTNAGGPAKTFLSSSAASPAAAYVPAYPQWARAVPPSLLEGEMVAVVVANKGRDSDFQGPDSVSISMWGAELNLVAAQHNDRTLERHSRQQRENSKSRFLHRQHLVVRQIVLSGEMTQEGTHGVKSPYRQRASAVHEELNCENQTKNTTRSKKGNKKTDAQTFDSYPMLSEDDDEDSDHGFQRKVVAAMRKELLWAPSRLAGSNASSSFSLGMGAPHRSSSIPVYTALYPIRLSDDLYEAKVQRVLAEAVAEGKQTVRAPCRVEMCRVPCGEKDNGVPFSSDAPAFVELSIEGLCFVPAHSTVQRHGQKKVTTGASGSHVHVPAAVWTVWSTARTDRFIISSAASRAVTAASGALGLADPSGADFYVVDFSAVHQDPSSPLQCVHIFDPASSTRDLVHTIALPWHLDGLIVKKIEGEGLGKRSGKTVHEHDNLTAPNPTWQVLLPRINGYNGSLPKPFAVFSQRAQRVFTIHSCLVARHTLRHVLCVWRLHNPYQLVEFVILPNVSWSGASYSDGEEDAHKSEKGVDDEEEEGKDGHRGWWTCGVRNESFVLSASLSSSSSETSKKRNEERSRRFKMSRFLCQVPAPIVSVSLRSVGSVEEGTESQAPFSPSGEYLFITFYSLQTLVYKVNPPMSVGAKGTVIVRPSVLSSAHELTAAAARMGLNNNKTTADSNNQYHAESIGRIERGKEEGIGRDGTPTVLTASEVLTLLQVHNCSSNEGGRASAVNREREGRLSSLGLQDPPPTSEELDTIRQHTLHFTSQLLDEEEEDLDCSPTLSRNTDDVDDQHKKSDTRRTDKTKNSSSLRRPFPCADTFTDQQRRAVIASYVPSALAWLLLMRGSGSSGKGVDGEESESNKKGQQQPLLTVGKTNTAQEGASKRAVALTSATAILPLYHQQQPRKTPLPHEVVGSSHHHHHQKEREHAERQHAYRLGPGGRGAKSSKSVADVLQPFTYSASSDALVTTPIARGREAEAERGGGHGRDGESGGGGLFYVERAAVHRSVTSPADQLQSPSPSSSSSYYASLSKPLFPLDHTYRYHQGEGNIAQTPTVVGDLHSPSTATAAHVSTLVVKESATRALKQGGRGIGEGIGGSLSLHSVSRLPLRVFGPDSFASKAMDAMGKRSQLLLLRRYWAKYVLFAEEEARRACTSTRYRGESEENNGGVGVASRDSKAPHNDPRGGSSSRRRLVLSGGGNLLGHPIARRGADYLWEGLMSARVRGLNAIKTGGVEESNANGKDIKDSIAGNSPPPIEKEEEEEKESKSGGLIVVPISLLFGNLFDLEPTYHDEDDDHVHDNDDADSDEVSGNDLLDGGSEGKNKSQSPRRAPGSSSKANGRKRANPAPLPLPQLLLPRLLRQRVLDHAPSAPLVSVLMGPEHLRACQTLIEACRENDVSLWISAPADELGAYECMSAVSGRFGDEKADENESEEEREKYTSGGSEEEKEGNEDSSSSHDEISVGEKMRSRKKVQRRASRDIDVDVQGISYASILRRMINEIEEPPFPASLLDSGSPTGASRQHQKASKRTASPSSAVNRRGAHTNKNSKKKPLSVVTNICGLPSLRRGYRSERHTALLTRFYAAVDNNYSSEHEQESEELRGRHALAIAEAEKELVSGLRETVWIRPVVLTASSNERSALDSYYSRDSIPTEMITPSLAHPSSVLVLMPSMYHVQCIRPVMDANCQYDDSGDGNGNSFSNGEARNEKEKGTASSSSSSRIMVAVHSILAPTLTCSDAYRTDLVEGLTAIVSGSVFKSKNTNTKNKNGRDDVCGRGSLSLAGAFSLLPPSARSYSSGGGGGRHRDPSVGIITRPSPASLRAAATVSVFDIVRRLFTESLPSAAMRGGRLVGRGALLSSANEKSKATSAETLRRKKEGNLPKLEEGVDDRKPVNKEEACPLPSLPLRIVRECSFTGETFVDVMTLAKF